MLTLIFADWCPRFGFLHARALLELPGRWPSEVHIASFRVRTASVEAPTSDAPQHGYGTFSMVPPVGRVAHGRRQARSYVRLRVSRLHCS